MVQKTGKIKTAVITGQHPYDVIGFQTVFRSIPEIDFYPQHMEDFATDTGGGRKDYDVVVFYNFHRATPGADGDKLGVRIKEAIEEFSESDKGLLVLHHAILAFPKWELWSDVCGIDDRSFGYHPEQKMLTEIASFRHPIVKGLTSWEMVDETYTMKDAGQGSEIVLAADHPKSMKTIAWTRKYKNARIFCYQSGHDNRAFSDPQFRTVVAQGIRWLAGRI